MKKTYALLLGTLAAGPASAQTAQWTGAVDDRWSTAGNWNPGVPLATGTAVFDTASLANLATLLDAPTTVAGITVDGAPGPVAISGEFDLAAGSIDLAGGGQLTVANGAAGFGFSLLGGSGILTVDKPNSLNWSDITAADALSLNGSLLLRGGTASTDPAAMAGSWTAVGGAGFAQATGSAFALDTGAAPDDARDFILTQAFADATLNLTSLSGHGTIRCDWSALPGPTTDLRSLGIDQDSDTTFHGMILSHHGGGDRIRNVGITKSGAGTLTLAGTVGRQLTASAGSDDQVVITLEEGALILTGDNTRQGPVTIATGTTLQVGDGGTTGTLGGAGTVALDGSLVIDRDGSFELPADLSGPGTLTKAGPGTVVLGGNSIGFTGPTDIQAGTVHFNDDYSASPVTVASGAAVAAGGTDAPGLGFVKTLTLEGGSTSTFRAGIEADLLTVIEADGFTVNGPHVISAVSAGGLFPGESVPIIDYDGTFSGFENLSLAPGSRFTLVHNTADTSIDLEFSGGTLVWTGASDGTWDINGTPNWELEGSPDVYLDGDDLVFDDTAGTGIIALSDTVTPGSILFENDSLAYQVSGGTLAGSGNFTKAGSAETVIASDTSYTGSTFVDEGTLTFGDGATVGEVGPGPVDLLEGSTLRIDRSDFLDYKLDPRMRTVSGAGDIVLDGGGTLFNYTGGGTGFSSPTTWSGFSGTLSILGGSEFQTIRNGATAMGTGDVILGDGSSSGSLSQIEGNWTWTNDIVLAGADNRIINRSAGAPRLLKLQGVISGSGGLTFEDATAAMTDSDLGFILTGANTLDGPLGITAGVPVRVGGIPGEADAGQLGPDAAGTLGAATVANEGFLTFSRTDAHTVANHISGAGEILVGLAAGGTETQAVTLTGNLSYTGPTTVRNGALWVNTMLPASAVTVDPAGTLGGTGTLGQDARVSGTVAPGASVGTLTTTADLALEPGSSILGEIGDWTGAAGSGFDTIAAATITLDATSAAPVTVVVTPDSLVNFDESSASFTLGSTSGGITGFSGDKFVVDASAFPGSGTFTVSVSGNDLVLGYSAGTADPYAAWETLNGIAGAGPDTDSDGDRVENGIEFVVDGDPNGTDSSRLLPVATTDATHLIFTYRRTDASAGYNPFVEYGDLDTWTLASDGDDGVTITVDDDFHGAGIDRVSVAIPRALAAGGRLFARLRFVLP